MKKAAANNDTHASHQISSYIAELTDWRGKLLTQLRQLIREVDPEIVEEWKWGTPVWSHNGNVVAAGVFKDKLKLNFFKGAALTDPQKLFNAGLDAKATRAIDIHENDKLNVPALKALIRAAVDANVSAPKSAKR